MAKNPVMQQKYQEGFNAGMQEAKAVTAAHFSIKLERLAAIPGIGPKRFQQIIATFMQELTPEELEEAALYREDFRRNQKEKGTAS